METIKICLSFVLIALYSARHGTATTCQTRKDATPGAASGKYLTSLKSGTQVEIYCEMGLNGGGYTFLPLSSLNLLDNDELSGMFKNRTSFLLRARKTDGTQPYAVLTQLSEYADIPLKLGLSNHTGYNAPINQKQKYIGKPYLYFGFLPIAVASNKSIQGLEVNGRRLTFKNADGNPNSQLTLFPNFGEVEPSKYNVSGSICDQMFSNLTMNPSGRVMPEEYFTFGETHWGGGCFTQTNQIPGILSLSIGFK